GNFPVIIIVLKGEKKEISTLFRLTPTHLETKRPSGDDLNFLRNAVFSCGLLYYTPFRLFGS
ncbi:TPA: hypothetical protein ACG7EP_002301, partial [Escherichia coli]